MLKKIAVTSLIAALFTAPFSAAASAQTVTTASSASASVSIQFSVESKVVVYGESSVTLNYASYISQGQVMVPLRLWADLLQAEVWYDVKTKYVTLKKGNNVVKFLLSGNHILVNGKKIKLKLHTGKKHGLTYVPVRVIAYALGTDLHWDAKKRVVSFSCGCEKVAGVVKVKSKKK